MARVETLRQKNNRLFTEFVLIRLHEKKKYQRDLAEHLGVTQQALSKKMNGQTRWTLGDIVDCCDYFGEDYTISGVH